MMESNIIYYLVTYLAIIAFILLFILSPLSVYLALKSFKLPTLSLKKTFLAGLILIVPSIVIYFLAELLPQTAQLNFFLKHVIPALLSLAYFASIAYRFLKTSLWRSMGLAGSYALINLLIIMLCVFTLSSAIQDKALSSGAKTWMSDPSANIADTENMYYSLMGFDTAADADPHQWGLQCMQAYQEYARQKTSTPKNQQADLKPPACISHETLSLDNRVAGLCDVRKENCLGNYRSQASEIKALSLQYQFLLDRYLALYRYAAFEPVSPRGMESPMVRLTTLMKAHSLLMARNGLKFLEGDKVKALTELKEDMAFQRRNLIRSKDLLFTMASVTFLTRDLYLYSYFMDMTASGQKRQEELEWTLLSLEEKDLEKLLQSEFQMVAPYLLTVYPETASEAPGWLSGVVYKLTYKPNATINIVYRDFQNILAWSRLPADQLSATPIKTVPPYTFRDVGYNPQGIILLMIGGPDFKPFIYRLHNLDGLIRLVKIKQKMRQDRIAKDQIEAFLKQDLPYFKNPYTNQPMTWDAKTETLFFNDPSREGQKIEIKIQFSL